MLIHIGPPLRVVVKSDIEGGELAVVTDMVVTGAMESVDNLHMEWHGVNGPGFIRTGEEAEMIDQLADAVSESPHHHQHACFPGDKSQQAERRAWPGQAGGGGGAGRRDVQRARRLPSLRRLQSPSKSSVLSLLIFLINRKGRYKLR